MRILIVSGLSGSGKSVALNMLEDLDFYCIDNIPVSLLGSMLSQLIESNDPAYENLALGIDARNKEADLNALPELFYSLRKKNISTDVIYLHADTDVLLKRYRETRRKHPLRSEGMSMSDAIERERQLLSAVSNTKSASNGTPCL